ncbi:hypothetical protein [Corynebacterium phoceense]|uniref:hypothetical protein n=1 Tax=Corynebacterium phoceense TaxID=1686286 RepID=UPI003BF4B7EB
MGRRRRTIAMLAMALGAFALGTTEFTSMGLLPLTAADFGVSEDTASAIISAYALGVVVGAGLGFGSPALAGAALSAAAVVLCVVAARLARSSAR